MIKETILAVLNETNQTRIETITNVIRLKPLGIVLIGAIILSIILILFWWIPSHLRMRGDP